MVTQKRAKIGGEIGTNGEFYEGGKFLPSTEQAKRRGSVPKKLRKEEVEPFVWELQPEGMRAIYRQIVIFARMNHETGMMERACHDETLAYYRTTAEGLQNLIDRFNAGERWMTQDEVMGR